eukprot:scaffold1442_cov128-Cylindrotheca_fusiformis.AAC.28
MSDVASILTYLEYYCDDVCSMMAAFSFFGRWSQKIRFSSKSSQSSRPSPPVVVELKCDQDY